MTGFPYYILRWLLIVLAGLLVYGQTFHFGFVFDDSAFVVTNVYIRNFSHIHGIWHFFPMTRLVGMYSFAFNYFLNGLAPQGYHIFNFIVHILNVTLVWALAHLIFKITKPLPSEDPLVHELPFIIAVLFLVHPCQTQAVTYISQRFESMATMFYLGTMYCYLRARVSTGRMCQMILFGLAGFLSIVGILTKEVVATVPVMMLASEWILFPKNDHRKASIILVAAGVLLYMLFSKWVYMDLRSFLQPVSSQSHDGEILTPARYFLTQMRVFLTFLRLLVLPIHQNLDYDYPASTGLLHPPLTLVGLGVMGSMIFGAIKLRQKFPLIAFGLAWMLITFSINLAPRSNVIFEHKLYLIAFGFFLAGVASLARFIRMRKIVLGILWGTIGILAMVSFGRNQVWRNDIVLWEDVVQKSPHKARPYNNRGLGFYAQGRFIQAIADYQKAIAINPEYANAYDNLGVVYVRQGKFAQAIKEYSRAIALNPDWAQGYNNRGAALFHQGDLTQALADYNKAIALNPGYVDAYSNRGIVYSHQGQLAAAIADFNRAIQINPDSAEEYNNRGNAYAKQREYSQAMADYNKAVDIDPHFAQTYNNRAVVFYQLKEYAKAWDNLRRAEDLGYAVEPRFFNALKEALETHG